VAYRLQSLPHRTSSAERKPRSADGSVPKRARHWDAKPSEFGSPLTTGRVLALCCYVAIAISLIWTRFASIRASLWHDEIYTVEHFIVGGPASFFGHYNPNDHILFSALAWLTVHLTGLGDSAYRLCSVLPFIAGVVLATAWLRRRAGTAVAILFALLSTASTQLLVLSTEARGYGLAFLAMALLTISAYEATTSGQSASLTVFAASGVIGCWTLPTFSLPLIGMTAVLLRMQSLRRPLAKRLSFVVVAVGTWYAVPASALLNSRDQRYGVRLPWHAPLTGAATELASAFVPSIDPSSVLPMLVVFPILAVGLVAARRRMPSVLAVTCVPTVFTYAALTLARFYVEERFVSYLLVPIFIVAAFGLSDPIAKSAWARGIGTAYSGALIATALLIFSAVAPRHARLPPEANREAAGTIAAALADAPRPVIFNSHDPRDVLYYLTGVRAIRPPHRQLERVICSPALRSTGAIFVEQPFGVRIVDATCLTRNGATVKVWRQWDRGGWIAVWVLPPEVARQTEP
jgi:hypothetical protein